MCCGISLCLNNIIQSAAFLITRYFYRDHISNRPLHSRSRSLSALRSPLVSLNNSDRQAIGSRKCIFSRRRNSLCHALAPATLYMTIAMSPGRVSRLSCSTTAAISSFLSLPSIRSPLLRCVLKNKSLSSPFFSEPFLLKRKLDNVCTKSHK